LRIGEVRKYPRRRFGDDVAIGHFLTPAPAVLFCIVRPSAAIGKRGGVIAVQDRSRLLIGQSSPGSVIAKRKIRHAKVTGRHMGG
jgi:hypothetical protein